jgi:hypothetical protein
VSLSADSMHRINKKHSSGCRGLEHATVHRNAF